MLILIDLRINILDGVQDNVTPICEISHLVDSKQQSGSPKQQVVTPIQQSGTPNQQMVTPLQQNGTSRINKMGCANCIIRYEGGFFFTGTPQFQYQKENLPSSQSRPFFVTKFTGTAALIGWLAAVFLVLKLGGPSEEEEKKPT